MKKYVLVVVGMMTALGLSAYETWTDPKTGIEWKYELNGDEMSVGSGDWNTAVPPGTSGIIEIPSEIAGKQVKIIGACAFCNCSGLESVTIPEGVTSIGEGAFNGCSGLTSVAIPASVTNVGEWAFSECCELHDVTVPGWRCGIDFSAVTNLIISEGTREIRGEAFGGCSGLTSVFISSSVTNIGGHAFSSCSGLTSVTIPSSVTSIGEGAFSSCSGLTSVTIPSSVTSIGEDAFRDTPFYDCQPDGCVVFGSVLYRYKGECPSEVEIPMGVISIGDWAFMGCENLSSVTIPSSVTSVGKYVFWDCPSLLSLTLPASIVSIGATTFYNSVLTSIIVDADNQYYSSENGLLLTKDGTTLVAGVNGDVIIPPSVTNIGNSAFHGRYGLTSVTIPSSVTSIGNYAFFSCSGLTSVIIPTSVTSIGEAAFRSCRGLTSVTIPSSVTCVSDWGFSECDGLTSVAISPGVSSIGAYAFHRCSRLMDITIPSSVTSIGYCAFYVCRRLCSVIIPSSVTSIGSFAFLDCSGLTNVIISAGVTSLGDGAFSGCSGLTSVTIPSSVKDIGGSAFLNCSGLTNVTISTGVASIGGASFFDCSSLTSVIIPSSVTSIGQSAFWGCSSLMNITIPASVTRIGKTVFLGCDWLSSIDFEGKPPSGLYSSTSIKSDASVRYNVAYEEDWLPVVEECGFANATPYVPTKPDGGPYTEVVDGVEWTFAVTNLESVVVGVPKVTAGKVTIPSTLGGRSVTRIGESAFDKCTGITGVVVPSSVVSVGANAFDGCTMVRRVEFEGAPSDGWLNAIPGAWTKIYYNETYDSEWKNALGASGIEDGISYVFGSEPMTDVCAVNLTVTNVVVHYVLNSVQPDIAVPISFDTGFVAVITEVKSTGVVSVPAEWKSNYPTFAVKYGNDFGKALMKKTGKKDGAGNDMLVWQDYVAGTDPTDEDDKFTASITFVDGEPVISYTPELTAEQKALRTYKTFGKMRLQDTAWTDITAFDGEAKKPYNFFKVTVEMK